MIPSARFHIKLQLTSEECQRNVDNSLASYDSTVGRAIESLSLVHGFKTSYHWQ
jgi:hypothetical protein